MPWQIDGTSVSTLTAETRTWTTLELTFRVDRSTRDATLRPLRDTARKFDRIPASDGTFSTLDRSKSGGVYTLTPPSARDPPRTERDYLVAGYEERAVDQAVSKFEVTVTFVAASNRDPDGTATDETRASDEWAFGLRAATIATQRVAADVREDAADNVEQVTLGLVLDATQTKVLEESLTRLDAATVRKVVDGANRIDDDSASPADANTFSIQTPDNEAPLPEGDYVATGWRTTWLTEAGYRLELVIRPSNVQSGRLGQAPLGEFKLGEA